MPGDADRVLKIEPETVLVQEKLAQHVEENVETLEEAKRVAGESIVDTIDISSEVDRQVKIVGQDFRWMRLNCNKWQNGFIGADQCIYGIPLKAEGVIKINTLTDEVGLLEISDPVVRRGNNAGGVQTSFDKAARTANTIHSICYIFQTINALRQQ